MNAWSRGCSTPGLWAAVLAHWLTGSLTAWVVSLPWLWQFERHAGPLPNPQSDLFTDGGMRFAAALGQTLDASPRLLWYSLALASLGYAVSLVCSAWLCVANARSEEVASAQGSPEHGSDADAQPPASATGAELGTAARVLDALPRFGVLLLPTGLFLGLFAFLAFVGVVVCKSVLLTPTDERTADLVSWGVAGALLLPALLLQPISDLARLQLVRTRRSPFAALRRATQVALYERRRLLGVWVGCTLGGWGLALGATALSQRIDPSGVQLTTLGLEQLGLLSLSCARSRWLSHAAHAIYENPRHAR